MTPDTSSADVPEQRRLRIVAALEGRDGVRAHGLAERFGVSVETIRRDLLLLEEQGLVRRVHGGAVRSGPRTVEAPFAQRKVSRLKAKQAMARLAAQLVEADDTVIFDVGTSVTEVARALSGQFAGRAITNSLPTATVLAEHTDAEILVAGGRVRRGDLACSGDFTSDFYRRFHVDRAFLGSGGIHSEAGLTDYHLDEIASRRVIIDRARETYVLADSSKIGQVAVGEVCPLERLTAVITDDAADPAEVSAIEATGIRVLIAAADPTGSAGTEERNRRSA